MPDGTQTKVETIYFVPPTPGDYLFTIYVNIAHPFYRRIYSELNKEAKLGIINLLGSMAITQHRTAELGVNLNDEYFWDTYWGDVSLQLVRIMNN
jgi:hypothetical protein